MRRRSRLLRVAKWGGVVVCGLLSTVWALSPPFPCGVAGPRMMVELDSGLIWIGMGTKLDFTDAAPLDDPFLRGFRLNSVIQTPSETYSFYGSRPPFTNRFFGTDAGLTASGMLFLETVPPRTAVWFCGQWFVRIPMWLMLIGVACPTTIAWWLNHRRPLPGHCPCGYDLTGNTSGRCPECGEVESIPRCCGR